MPSEKSETRREWIILLTTILGSGMVFLDGTVVNLALPALQSAFSVDMSIVQWFIEAYGLTLASLLLIGGSLGDRYGRRRIYVYGTILFAVASLACGLATNSAWLIAGRAVQGVGGALLVPGGLALITSNFPAEGRGRAIGTWSALSAITTAVGPVVGGWLIEHSTWRWVFFLNLPFALIIVILCVKVPETKSKEIAGRLDWQGAIAATCALIGITYALIQWPSNTQHLWLLFLSLCSLLAFAAFLAIERRSTLPMLPLSLFQSRNFTGANLLTFFMYAPLGALLFFTPMDLIGIQHYTASEAGAAFLPFVVTLLLLSRWAGRLVERYGARLPLVAGSLIAGLGYALFATSAQSGQYWSSFFPGVFALSVGMSLIVAPLSTTIMDSVPESHAGIASGVNNAVSRLASLIAVAVFGSLLAFVFSKDLDSQVATLRLPAREQAAIHASRFQLTGIKTFDPRVGEAVRYAFIHAYRVVLWSTACSALMGTLIGWLIISPSHREWTKNMSKLK